MRSAAQSSRPFNNATRSFPNVKRPTHQVFKRCSLCQQSGRCDFPHYLSQCSYLPESDRNFISKAQLISDVEDIKLESEQVFDSPVCDNQPAEPVNSQLSLTPVSRRVQLQQSLFLILCYDHFPLKVVIDSGATANLIERYYCSFYQVYRLQKFSNCRTG